MKNKITTSFLMIGITFATSLASAESNKGIKEEFYRKRAIQRTEQTIQKALPFLKQQGCDTEVRDTESDEIGTLYISTWECVCQVYSRRPNARGGEGLFDVQCIKR